MNVRYTKTALRELDNILFYIAERNRPAARAVNNRIERIMSLLGEFPFIGHATDEDDVRAMPVVGYPFLIFYAITDEVIVLHIRHAARLRP